MRLPIHAPVMPSVNRTNGTTQHDAAPNAARMPPKDISSALRVEGSARLAFSGAVVVISRLCGMARFVLP